MVLIMRIELNDYIVSDSEICRGSLTFKGTRILVGQVIELMGAGVTIEEILRDYFPQLNQKIILSALNYASKSIESEKYVSF